MLGIHIKSNKANSHLSLSDDSSIYEFLKYDKHCKLADKVTYELL